MINKGLNSPIYKEAPHSEKGKTNNPLEKIINEQEQAEMQAARGNRKRCSVLLIIKMKTLKQGDVTFPPRTGRSVKPPGHLVVAMVRGRKFPRVYGEAVTRRRFLGKWRQSRLPLRRLWATEANILENQTLWQGSKTQKPPKRPPTGRGLSQPSRIRANRFKAHVQKNASRGRWPCLREPRTNGSSLKKAKFKATLSDAIPFSFLFFLIKMEK